MVFGTENIEIATIDNIRINVKKGDLESSTTDHVKGNELSRTSYQRKGKFANVPFLSHRYYVI